ncbi:hypothetical protein CPB85DRAFT_1437362 [Mucidula mucida]|nr:hypothetical protein CPB85DRAFT_1437362 [Mucidula mucida]
MSLFALANLVRVNARALTAVSRCSTRSLSSRPFIARPTLLPKTLRRHSSRRWITDAAQPRKVLFFGNLPFKMSESDIVRELEGFGAIGHIHKGTNTATKQSIGWAIIEFQKEDVAERVLLKHEAQPFVFDGRVAILNWAKNQNVPSVRQWKRSDRAPSSTLFMTSLPFRASEDEVEKSLSQYGPIKRVVIRRLQERTSGGYAHIEFCDLDSAVAAYEASMSSPITIKGRPVVVDYDLPKPPKARENDDENRRTPEAEENRRQLIRQLNQPVPPAR